MPVTAQSQSALTTAAAVEKVITAAIWLINNNQIVGKTVAEFIGGVTNVKEWVNHTGTDLEVFKGVGRDVENHYKIPAGQTRSAEMWLPWAENSDEYRTRHTTFLLGGKPFGYVWQSRKIVRFNLVDSFVKYGPMAPGASGAGGDRRATFGTDSNGQPAFVLSVL
jgi:hypothetical protein